MLVAEERLRRKIRCVTSRHVTSHHAMSRHVTLRHVTSRQVTARCRVSSGIKGRDEKGNGNLESGSERERGREREIPGKVVWDEQTERWNERERA